MQALETIKVVLSQAGILSDQNTTSHHPSMTIFAAFQSPQWRTFRLRARKENCPACGKNPSITAENIQTGDYFAICRRVNPNEIIERVTVQVSGSGLE
jgi:adenylyltransferase and sulfurtransferase